MLHSWTRYDTRSKLRHRCTGSFHTFVVVPVMSAGTGRPGVRMLLAAPSCQTGTDAGSQSFLDVFRRLQQAAALPGASSSPPNCSMPTLQAPVVSCSVGICGCHPHAAAP